MNSYSEHYRGSCVMHLATVWIFFLFPFFVTLFSFPHSPCFLPLTRNMPRIAPHLPLTLSSSSWLNPGVLLSPDLAPSQGFCKQAFLASWLRYLPWAPLFLSPIGFLPLCERPHTFRQISLILSFVIIFPPFF